MSKQTVKVNMFGDFSIEYDAKQIDDNSSRSKKVWLLLAYLIYNRKRNISQSELADLIWREEESSADPRGALKALLYRARVTLDELGESAGHDLIVNNAGAYAWNPEFKVKTDVDEFDRLLSEAEVSEDPSHTLKLYRAAIKLYTGNFLAKLSMEPWVVPIDVYYTNAYTGAVLETLDLMKSFDLNEELCETAFRAIQFVHHNEAIHAFLMDALIALGRKSDAAEVYERFRDQLYTTFSVEPSEELRNIYRKATKSETAHQLSPDALFEQLEEPEPSKGALICEYDFFKILYYSAARSIARSGDAIHTAMLSVRPRSTSPLSKRSLEIAMDNLQEQIRLNLRSGDSAARCSRSQFIIMLPQANFENSNKVCDRIISAFNRRHPHSPAYIDFCVKAVEPMQHSAIK